MPIKKIVPPPVTADAIQDSVSRAETGDSLTVPGRFRDWLTPRPKGQSVLDPVLIAARKASEPKAKGKRTKTGPYARKPVDPASVETGHDGLPRPGRK